MKINKSFVCNFILFLLCSIGFFYLGYNYPKQPVVILNPVQEDLTKINCTLDSLKTINDSLLNKNDSIQIKIVKIKEEYEKTSDIILSNDVDEDYVFFTNYINSFGQLCSNYSTTTQDN